MRYRDSYDSSKGSPAAWLIGIARRLLGAVPPAGYEIGDVPETASSLDLEEEVIARLDVGDLVGRLEGRDRELIALRYGADLNARQIGEVLDMRTNSVEVALHRALARLRTLIDEDRERDSQPRSASGVRL